MSPDKGTGTWPWRAHRGGRKKERPAGVGQLGQAAGRWDLSWARKGDETSKWRGGKGAPGPGNGLSKGEEVGRSLVCSVAGRALESNQVEGAAGQGSLG